MDILAKIESIKYTPIMAKKDLNNYYVEDLEKALSRDGTFLLTLDNNNKIAVSWWVSAKRTRSYPYARIYDSLGFKGKQTTIIPICKDEGQGGDRDFLQYDTVSLMSLLQVYVIIGYYLIAIKNTSYSNKITNQRFDVRHIYGELEALSSYRSDALHWNLEQLKKVPSIAEKSLKAYKEISKKLGVQMHSEKNFEIRINELMKGVDEFLNFSRKLAEKAQHREMLTIQPKENVEIGKAKITIKNYLGGYYYFTADEAKIVGKDVLLIEAKHTKTADLPSLSDIKDGLLKMILFTNLQDVTINNRIFNSIPILKLTTGQPITKSEELKLKPLIQESSINRFRILLNKSFIT
ncbi:MAG: hypothetical protein AB1480_03935 [Nitrospirota bacterium]